MVRYWAVLGLYWCCCCGESFASVSISTVSTCICKGSDEWLFVSAVVLTTKLSLSSKVDSLEAFSLITSEVASIDENSVSSKSVQLYITVFLQIVVARTILF